MLAPDDINRAFGRAEISEWPRLALRVMRYSDPILESQHENERTAQVCYQAFDEVDFAVWTIFPDHKRKEL